MEGVTISGFVCRNCHLRLGDGEVLGVGNRPHFVNRDRFTIAQFDVLLAHVAGCMLGEGIDRGVGVDEPLPCILHDVHLFLNAGCCVPLFENERCDAVLLMTFLESHVVFLIVGHLWGDEASSMAVLKDELSVCVCVSDRHVGACLRV